jgi:putative glutamine amidotransferase
LQVLNVALGGTLIPDIEDFTLHRGHGGDAVFVDEHVRLAADSRLARLVGGDDLVVRTGHHQAVAAVAPSLRAVGWADDGIVEAVEHESAWAFGVQWHPEDSHGSQTDRLRLFAAFVAELRSRSARP